MLLCLVLPKQSCVLFSSVHAKHSGSSIWFNFGFELEAAARVDASAVLAVIHRQGFGKLRHMIAHWSWIRGRVKHGDVKTLVVHRKVGPAGVFIKHLFGDEVAARMNSFEFQATIGRSHDALTIGNIEREEGEDEDEDHWGEDGQCNVRTHRVPRRTLRRPYRYRWGFPSRRVSHRRV